MVVVKSCIDVMTINMITVVRVNCTGVHVCGAGDVEVNDCTCT